MTILNINNIEYEILTEKLTSNSQYFNTMLTDFAEKDQSIIDIKLDDFFDINVINYFIKFIDTESLDMKYCYPIYLLLKYFEYNNHTFEKFEQLVVKYNNDIDINTILSLIYLSKEVKYIDLNKYFKDCEVDDNYLYFIKHLYSTGLKLDDFLKIYNIWFSNLNESKHQKYLLIDVFKLNRIKYKSSIDNCFENPLNQYKDGQKITVKSIDKFKKHLSIFSSKLINDTFITDLDWTNICISGGAVLANVLRKPLDAENSDIDFWIYGENIEERYRYLIKYLEDQFTDIKIYYSVAGGVTTLIIPKYRRNIQIILTDYKTPYEIVKNFDMSYIRCVYDGRNVLGTVEFIESLQTQTIHNDPLTKYNIPRIAKAYRKGYSFKNFIADVECEFTKDTFNQYILETLNDKGVIKNMNKYYYPTMKECINSERLKYMIGQIFNSKNVCIGSDELFDKITYKICDFNTDPYIKEVITNLDKLDSLKNISLKKGAGPHVGHYYHFSSPIVIKTPYLHIGKDLIKHSDIDNKVQIQLDLGDGEFRDKMIKLDKIIYELAYKNRDVIGFKTRRGDTFENNYLSLVKYGTQIYCNYSHIDEYDNLKNVKRNGRCSVKIELLGIGCLQNRVYIKRTYGDIKLKSNDMKYYLIDCE